MAFAFSADRILKEIKKHLFLDVTGYERAINKARLIFGNFVAEINWLKIDSEFSRGMLQSQRTFWYMLCKFFFIFEEYERT